MYISTSQRGFPEAQNMLKYDRLSLNLCYFFQVNLFVYFKHFAGVPAYYGATGVGTWVEEGKIVAKYKKGSKGKEVEKYQAKPQVSLVKPRKSRRIRRGGKKNNAAFDIILLLGQQPAKTISVASPPYQKKASKQRGRL